MVQVRVETRGGCLHRLSIDGHDTTLREGESLPCGIVSALARTVARLLEQEMGIQWSGDAPEPGSLWLVIEHTPEQREERLKGITDFLLTGLQDVAQDFPDIIQFEVKRI